MAEQLVITGGRLIDPAQGIDGRYDIAVEDGRVVAIAPQIDATANHQRIDAGGKLVTPGLIDFATHINWGTLDCLDPDLVAARGAVTCNVDMGTVGAQDFVQFKTFIVKGAKSRVYSYLNASCIGMLWTPEYFELETLWVPDGMLLFMQRPQDLIPAESAILKGLTMRVFGPKTAGNKTAEAVALAKDVALLAGAPLVLQLAELPNCLPEILSMLDGGDMLSRVYNSLVGPHLFGDADPRTRSAFEAAIERGVLLDVGHGLGGFNFKVAEKALQQGYLPNTISSGIYGDCADSVVYDLPTTLSKFLNLGMPLNEVIRRATQNPARLIGAEGELGTLRVGGPADISILQLEAGDFNFVDGQGGTLRGTSRLKPVLAICGGTPLSLPAELPLTAENWFAA